MNEIYLLLKFLKKANKEIAEDPSEKKVVFMRYITSLIGKVTGDTEKRLVKLAKKKRPLQHLLNLYSPHKSDYINQATTIITNSYDVLKPDVPPFFYDINDGYYFYVDGNPLSEKKDYCYSCVVDKQTDKTIYDFTCSYERYQSGYYTDDLAIAIFILNYYLKEKEQGLSPCSCS